MGNKIRLLVYAKPHILDLLQNLMLRCYQLPSINKKKQQFPLKSGRLSHEGVCSQGCWTHIAALVRNVVSQFEFVKADHLLHPLLARARRVRVDVTSPGHLGVSLAGHCPLAVVELVPG